MKLSLLIMGLQVSLLEIILFQAGAVVLGFAIHFFMTSRKNMKVGEKESEIEIDEADEWRLKYYEQTDLQEKLKEDFKMQLLESKENEEVLQEELRLMRMEKERIMAKQEEIKQQITQEDYMQQLKTTQENLLQHNQHITRLVEQINLLKEAERKYSASMQQNEELQSQLRELRKMLLEREGEIKQIRQQQTLTREVKDRLDKAYGEFNIVQEKIQKVEGYLVQPQNRNFEYDELQQGYFKLTKEFDELKLKYISLLEDNQRMTRILADTEDKLREANFQRQQLIKKVGFLEELNNDLQQVSEHNKKLESQLRRIGEIENLLAKISVPQRPDESDIQGIS